MMDEVDVLNRLIDEAPEHVLATTFTEEEREDLLNIKHELNFCIKWGPLVKQMAASLLAGLDTLIFIEQPNDEPSVVKANPYESLFPRDRERINGPHDKAALSRKYVLLHLLKKLLGALKTHVNKEMAKIRIISEADHELVIDCIEAQKGIDGAEPDEEEMDLVSPENEGDQQEVRATIHVGEDRGCDHPHTTYRQVPSTQTKSGSAELHGFCKRCRQTISVKPLGDLPTSHSFGGRFRKPRKCQHPRASWEEGQEGKVAICSACDEVLEDSKARTMRWVAAGLEPYGDDPEKDEIQHFSVQQSMEMEA